MKKRINMAGVHLHSYLNDEGLSVPDGNETNIFVSGNEEVRFIE
jgi:hypothetical protein